MRMIVSKSSLFDHLNAIYTNQAIDYWDTLSVENRKSYNVYMINRFISMNLDQLEVVNMFQQFWGEVGPRESYLFYSQFIPYGRQFNKYIKAPKEGKLQEWVVELVARYYKVSMSDATDYTELMLATAEGKEALQEILEAFGTDPKKVKRAVK